ncbi:MAG: hypothetical protein ACI4QI_05250, partial [Candidatus Coproplasma sp.]
GGVMKRNQVEKNAVLQDDILRYRKNKLPANLALLALVFNILYFTLLYTIHTTQIYTILVGVSVIVNLLVLLFGFYASEGIKAYNKKICIMLLVLAVAQIVRIFIYPLQGLSDNWMQGNAYFGVIMTTASNGVLLIIYLAASAGCFIASAVLGYINCNRLEAHLAKVESGAISVEETMKELDEQELGSETKEVVAPIASEEVDNG